MQDRHYKPVVILLFPSIGIGVIIMTAAQLAKIPADSFTASDVISQILPEGGVTTTAVQKLNNEGIHLITDLQQHKHVFVRSLVGPKAFDMLLCITKDRGIQFG
jgi:hypothetical protein